jgi:hypothetical protein
MMAVSKVEFWAFVMNAKSDIVSEAYGPYPYTSIFKSGGIEVGRIVGSYGADCIWPTVKSYFLEVAL